MISCSATHTSRLLTAGLPARLPAPHPLPAPQNNVKMRSRHLNVVEKAFVRFTSPLEAHRAVRERQGGFIGSNQLRLRVLQ